MELSLSPSALQPLRAPSRFTRPRTHPSESRTLHLWEDNTAAFLHQNFAHSFCRLSGFMTFFYVLLSCTFGITINYHMRKEVQVGVLAFLEAMHWLQACNLRALNEVIMLLMMTLPKLIHYDEQQAHGRGRERDVTLARRTHALRHWALKNIWWSDQINAVSGGNELSVDRPALAQQSILEATWRRGGLCKHCDCPEKAKIQQDQRTD